MPGEVAALLQKNHFLRFEEGCLHTPASCVTGMMANINNMPINTDLLESLRNVDISELKPTTTKVTHIPVVRPPTVHPSITGAPTPEEAREYFETPEDLKLKGV